MLDDIFEIVYFVEFLLISIIRTIYTSPYRKLKVVLDKKTTLDIVLLGLAGLGMVMPLVYLFSSVLDFADYMLPNWLGWIGGVIFGLAICLLWRSHVDLGRNWTPTLGVRKEHILVTEGVYKYIRHPMYAAHLLWAIAQVLMLHNWIAGFSFLVVMVPLYLLRVNDEEQMMLEKFGDEYRAYIGRTGRIIPHLSKDV